MITRIYSNFSLHTSFGNSMTGQSISSGEGKQQTPYFNVPLQTREHALAGISGMLRSPAEAQGAFTSRGAKPNGLESHAHGLHNNNNNKKHIEKIYRYIYI
jgi:hypothetical protein